MPVGESGSPKDEFVLAVTMAGAVSAGAYNAGVFDFLVQALEEWELAKAADLGRDASQRSVPNHRVIIPVVTGASAGGVVAALGLLALSANVSLPKGDADKARCVLPLLYQAWVESISFTGNGAKNDGLLGAADLERDKPLLALLDATSIDQMAKRIIHGATKDQNVRPYICSVLHLFLTVTNLRGIPFKIGFNSSSRSDGHIMSLHGDRVHYRLEGFGTARFQSEWLRRYQDDGIGASIKDLRNPKFQEEFVESAIATGAFPVGLPARMIRPNRAHYSARAWPYSAMDDLGRIEPHWPAGTNQQPYAVDFAASDGGIVDNEPFEIARWTIMKVPGKQNNPCAKEADRAVLLIDPFPEPPSFDPDLSTEEINTQAWLRSVIMALFPALKNQARVKAIDLARTTNMKVFSRFMVAPSRQIGAGEDEKDAADPLACGVLGAFGGFLQRSFPEHDYQLGRRNCQKFLRDHFVLDKENALFLNWPAAAKVDKQYHVPPRDGHDLRPIIPLCGSAIAEVQPLDWPSVDDSVVDNFMNHVRNRANALVRKIARKDIRSRVARWGVSIGWRFFRSSLLRRIRLTLVSELVRRDQHSRWRGRDDLDRAIIAALLNPSYGARTAAGITREINRRWVHRDPPHRVAEQAVADRLNRALASETHTYKHKGKRVHQHTSRASRWRRLPVLGRFNEWLNPLSVDWTEK